MEGNEDRGVPNRNNLRCFDCKSKFHLAGSRQCRTPHAGKGSSHTGDYCSCLSSASANYPCADMDREEVVLLTGEDLDSETGQDSAESDQESESDEPPQVDF